MIFLLNAERVFTECLLGLKTSIAQKLEIPEQCVTIRLEKTNDGTSYIPEVTLETPSGLMAPTFTSLTPEEIQLGVEKLIEQALAEIKIGLAGLHS